MSDENRWRWLSMACPKPLSLRHLAASLWDKERRPCPACGLVIGAYDCPECEPLMKAEEQEEP